MGAVIIETSLDTTGFEQGYKRAAEATKTFVKTVSGNIGSLKSAFNSLSGSKVATPDMTKLQGDFQKAQAQVGVLSDKLKALQEQRSKVQMRSIVTNEDTAKLESLRIKMSVLEAAKDKIWAKGVVSPQDAVKLSDLEVKLSRMTAEKTKLESKHIVSAEDQAKINAINSKIDDLTTKWQSATDAAGAYQSEISRIQNTPQDGPDMSGSSQRIGAGIGSGINIGVTAGIASLTALLYAANQTSDEILRFFGSMTKGVVVLFAKMVSPIVESLVAIQDAVNSIFNLQNIVAFGKESLNAAKDIQAAWVGMQSIAEGQGRNFAEAKKFIQDYISDGLVPATEAVTAYKNLAMRGYTDDQIVVTMKRLKDSAAFGRQASLSMGEAIRSATEGLKNENSILVDNAGVTKNVSMMWKDYAKARGIAYTELTKEQKIQAEVNGIMEETRFQIGDAAKVTGNYAGEIMNLAYVFNQLKVAVGKTIMPMAQVVIPVVTQLITIFTQLFNTLSQVTQVLFAAKATMAGSAKATQSASKATADAVKSTQALGKATKDTKKKIDGSTSSLDELSTIMSKTADVTTDATETLGQGISPVDVPEPKVAWIDTLAEKIKSIKVDYSFFFDMGKDIGSKLTAGLNAIDWRNMQTWAMSMVDKLTAYLNGAVAGSNLGAVGKTIAQSFNTVLLVAYSWFTGFDFRRFGDSIAKGFNKFIDTFAWGGLGKTLGAQLMSVVDMASGFVFRFDWLGFGKNLAKTVMNFFASVDWYELGLTIGTAIVNAVNMVTTFLQNVDWAKIGNDIKSFLMGLDWTGIRDAVVDMFNELWAGGLDLAKALFGDAGGIAIMVFIDGIIQGIIFIKSLFILLKAVLVIILALIGFFAIGLNAIVAAIVWVIKVIVDLFVLLVKLGQWLPEKFIQIQIFLRNTMLAMIANLGKLLFGFAPKIGDFFKTLIGNILDPIKSGFVGIVNFVSGLLSGVVNTFIRVINFLTGALNTIKIDVPDWVPSIGGKKFGFNIAPIGEVKIPKLATGAVIPPNKEFMAILGDQKSGTNIEAPEGLIRKIVAEENGATAALLQELINVMKAGQTLVVDDKVLAKVVTKNQAGNSRQLGKTVIPV